MRLEPLFTSQGWRRRGLAALLGVCAAAALPPFYVLPLLVPAFAGLFLLVCHATGRRQAFFDGWWWGLGYFTSGLYWICISLFVDPVHFAWLTPIVLFGLPSVLAIYTGLVTLLLYCIHGSSPLRGEVGASAPGGGGDRILSVSSVTPSLVLPPQGGGHTIQPVVGVVIFAALWVIAEYLRAHLFTGFPWNLIGYVWTVSDVTLQFASVVGIYGLSWIAVLAATVPALFLLPEKRVARLFNLAAACMLAAMIAFGVWRLETHPTRFTGVKIRIVQGNITQSLKWEPKEILKGLKKQVHLTQSPGLESVKLVLWPETAVPYAVMSNTALTQDLGSILPPGALLVTGGLRVDEHDQSRAWNSVFAIDGHGTVVAQYDKHHLVPFGEYIPLRDLSVVEAIAKAVAPGMGDFSRGPGPQTLTIDPYPAFSPLICYEAIFPGEATDGTGRAEWLASFTDDAWFGVSSGPHQDVQMARVRAIEQGLPLLRAANTGVSGAFDAYGRTLATLSLEKEGILDLHIPEKEARGTIFTLCQPLSSIFMIGASLVFLWLGRRKKSLF